MRFKTSLSPDTKHSAFVTCVGWSNTEEVYSCGDDHVLLKWNVLSNETVKVADLPEDLYATDLHWFPRTQVGGKRGPELILITSADGKFHLVSKTGRFEKSVEAHTGAVLCGRWSYDGAGLLTAGEDGHVKVWSRTGMLRSTVVQCDTAVYGAAWGPDSNQVLHTMGRMLVIKPLAPNSKPTRWMAHEGLILKVAWNPNNNLIVSGGEDCHFKVWDTYGRLVYTSLAHEFPITSVSWTPRGDLFAIGSFNTLRLCDKSGWSYSLEKPNTGSLLDIAWSSDGTQVAGAGSNGHVIFAHIIERRLEWVHLEVTMTALRTVSVRNVLDNTREVLEFPDRVIMMSLGYGHLVVVTPTQCHVYRKDNWNTPAMFDIRDGSVSMVQLADRHMLVVDKSSLGLYNYEGRLLCSPRWPGMQPDSLNERCVAISPDTIAVRDQVDNKLVHVFELGSTRTVMEALPLTHTMGVLEVALNQAGPAAERQLALLDKNRDLYLSTLRGTSTRKLNKLGPMVLSLCWNSDTNMLAAVQDTSLVVWYYPTVVYVDKQLLKKTSLVKDASEFSKAPAVVSFNENNLAVRRVDGSLVNWGVTPFPRLLHRFTSARQWDHALRFCRIVRDPITWACLAAMATHAKDLATAEEGYAAIDELDKVLHLQYIKGMPVRAVQLAEMALLGGNMNDAENILLQNGLVFRAIYANMSMHCWNRALELAIKHKTHIDTVLFYRRKYLDSFEKPEINDKFLQFQNEVELDAEKIVSKVELEFQREREAA